MVAIREQSILEKKETSEKITWEVFEAEYLSREDGYKYEWVDGYVEKTTYTINKEQLFILKNLQLFFQQLNSKASINGLLMAEIDTKFADNHRRPDISFVTFDQIEAGKKGKDLVPEFVVEVISTNDQINKVQKKMEDYHRADVAVVWHVFPEIQVVHVYKGNQMTVCRAKDICSADSIIKGFEMTVEEIFA